MDTIWDLNNMEYTSDEIEYWLKEEYTMNKIGSTYEPKNYFRDLIIKKRIQENETIMGNIKKAVDNLYENILSMIEDYNSANRTKFTYIECFGKNYSETENIQKRINHLNKFTSGGPYKIIINYIFANINNFTNSIYDKDEIKNIKKQLSKLYSQQYNSDYVYDIPYLNYYVTCLLNRQSAIFDERVPDPKCTGDPNPNYIEYLYFFKLPNYEENNLHKEWFRTIGRYRRVHINNNIYTGSGYSGATALWSMMVSLFKSTNTLTNYAYTFFTLLYWLCPYHHTLEEILNMVSFLVLQYGITYGTNNINNNNDLFNYLLKIALEPHNNA